MDENKMTNSDNIQPISDSELDEVSGGAGNNASGSGREVKKICPKCKKQATITVLSGTRGKCNSCNAIIEI